MLRFAFVLSLSIAALMPSTAEATVFADARVRQLTGSLNVDLCGGINTPIANASCSQNGAYDGEARATAAHGSLGTSAELVYASNLPFPNDDYQAYGWASWSDTISISSSLIEPGALTDARMVFNISGTGERTPPDFFDGGTLFVATTFRVVVGGLEVFPNNGEFTGPGTYQYDFNFEYGNTLPILVELISDVRCLSCGGPYRGLSDYLNTAVLDEVQLTGLSQGDFTVSSGEGQSYANVVPEPSTGLLLSGGLLGLAIKRRRAATTR